MAQDDLAVVFLGGHGVRVGDKGDTALLTSPATDSTAIAWSLIPERIGYARGRVLVLLDACHAGHITHERIIPNHQLASRLSRSARSGVVVFAASKGRQQSYELGERVKGVTRIKRSSSLTPGDNAEGTVYSPMRSSAVLGDPTTDRSSDGAIDIDDLAESVRRRVDQATGGQQMPWLSRREIFGTFTVTPERSNWER